MPQTASRAVLESKILENTQAIVLSPIRVHQSESQQASKPDDGFEIDLANYSWDEFHHQEAADGWRFMWPGERLLVSDTFGISERCETVSESLTTSA
jgi:hypothetical protein